MRRTSQSALEYMMTYGWAILIIVIVAGVLYSMGIFSPSSSVSATVTGFSSLGSVSAQCIGNQGLTVQLGNSAGYPVQIQNISVSSNGKTVTVSEQQIISQGGSSDFYISNVCPSPSTRYSLTVMIYYTEPGQPFPGPFSSSGTITGSASTQQISSSPAFNQIIPITITNSQSSSTPSPFQQMVIIPSQVYGGYAASNFQNVEFFYANGTIIPSWLSNYTSLNAIYWLKVQSIPTNSVEIVYMGFVSQSVNLFNNNNVGEAPQLSTVYNEYNDAKNVFLYSVMFNGSSLPTGWSSTGSLNYSLSGKYLQMSSTAANWGAVTYPYSDSNITIITYANLSNGVDAYWKSIGMSENVPGGYDLFTIGTGDYGGPHTLTIAYEGRGAYDATNYNDSNKTRSYIISNYNWSSGAYVNYNQFVRIPIDENTLSNLYLKFEIYSASNGLNTTMQIYWLNVANSPPNDIMPSVSFGYPSNITKPANIQSYASVTISNNQNKSVSTFQQMVNVPSSVFSGYANTASGTAFQNVEFFYANGSIVPSWLENYTSSNARYWIKIPSLPADTSFTVYLGFASTATNLFNTVNTGEAPQISPTYAEYDNGANVFNNYWNFAGTALPSDFTTSGTRSYTINNGINLTSGGSTWTIGTTQTFGSGTILEFYGDFGGSNGGTISTYASWGYMNNNGAPPSSLSGIASGVNIGGFGLYNWNPSTNANVQTTYDEGITQLYSVAYTGTESFLFYNYVNKASLSTDEPTFPLPFGVGFQSSYVGTIYMQYARTRAYPPNGVMPSISFSSMQ